MSFTTIKSDSAIRLARELIETGKIAREKKTHFGEEEVALIIRERDEREFGQARRCQRVRGRNPLFDALAIATGTRDLASLTRIACKTIGIALAEILEVCPGLTEKEIYRVVSAYKQQHPTWTCSALAVAKHWAEFTKNQTTRSAKLDPYIEPAGWRDVLRQIGKTWDPEYMQEALAQGWNEVSFTVRMEILQAIQRNDEVRTQYR